MARGGEVIHFPVCSRAGMQLMDATHAFTFIFWEIRIFWREKE